MCCCSVCLFLPQRPEPGICCPKAIRLAVNATEKADAFHWGGSLRLNTWAEDINVFLQQIKNRETGWGKKARDTNRENTVEIYEKL